MQKPRSNRQDAFLISMTALLLAFGCASDDDSVAPRADGASGSGSVTAVAGRAAGLASSGASAGGAVATDTEANDGGTTSAGAPASAGSGDAGRVAEAGEGGQAGEPGAFAGSSEGGFAGQDDQGGASRSGAGSVAGGATGGAAGHAHSGGSGGSSRSGGGAGSIATLPCDVRAVLKSRCQSCHGNPPSNLAPMSLLTWSAVSMYADAIQEKLDGDLMPPPGSPDLSPDQQNALLAYVSLGAPPAGNVTCP